MSPSIRKAGYYEAFIFDLDGTLIRLPVEWGKVVAGLQRLFGVPSPLGPAFSTLDDLLKGRPELREESFGIVDRYEMESIPNAFPVRGAAELVRALSVRSGVSVVTMQGRKACGAALGRLGVAGAVRTVVTREDSMSRSGQIGIALGGGSPAGALFVGDLQNDAKEGMKAGVDVAVIGGSDYGLGPGHAFPSCEELGRFLLS